MITQETKAKLPSIIVPISSIVEGERIRQDFGLEELVESIKEVGLIQPIVVDISHRLIDGGRRLAACKKIGLKEIEIVYREVLSDEQVSILEVEANKHKRFNWKETCLAIDKIHRTKSLDAAINGERWTMLHTAKVLGYAGQVSVYNATVVAEYLRSGDKEICDSESLKAAHQVLLLRKENEAMAALAKLTTPKDGGLSLLSQPLDKLPKPPTPRNPVEQLLASSDKADSGFFSEVEGYQPGIGAVDDGGETPGQTVSTEAVVIPLSKMLYHESGGHNSLSVLKSFGPEWCDHIISDPPYGIDMSNLQQNGSGMDVSTTAAEHDVKDNLTLISDFLPLAYSAIKPNGFCILFGDYSNWQFLVETSLRAGFKVQPWPLIWVKTHSCLNQAAQYNFTKNHELAIVLRKGNATVLTPQPSSVWTGSNDVESRSLGHPFAKPFGLWKWLYKAVALQGATVCDPFVGRGSSVIPAIQLGLRPVGIESNLDHYNALNENIRNVYKSMIPNVQFN